MAYTANFLAGVVTAIRGGFPAEPLGIRTRLPIAVDACVGNGTALSAPPALIFLLWRLLKGSSQSHKTKGRLVLLTSIFLAGAVAEPLAHRSLGRGLPNHVKAIAALNVALPAVMLVGVVRSLVEPEPADAK